MALVNPKTLSAIVFFTFTVLGCANDPGNNMSADLAASTSSGAQLSDFSASQTEKQDPLEIQTPTGDSGATTLSSSATSSAISNATAVSGSTNRPATTSTNTKPAPTTRRPATTPTTARTTAKPTTTRPPTTTPPTTIKLVKPNLNAATPNSATFTMRFRGNGVDYTQLNSYNKTTGVRRQQTGVGGKIVEDLKATSKADLSPNPERQHADLLKLLDSLATANNVTSSAPGSYTIRTNSPEAMQEIGRFFIFSDEVSSWSLALVQIKLSGSVVTYASVAMSGGANPRYDFALR